MCIFSNLNFKERMALQRGAVRFTDPELGLQSVWRFTRSPLCSCQCSPDSPDSCHLLIHTGGHYTSL